MRQITLINLLLLIFTGIGLFAGISSAIRHTEERRLKIRKRTASADKNVNKKFILFAYIVILTAVLCVLFLVLFCRTEAAG